MRQFVAVAYERHFRGIFLSFNTASLVARPPKPRRDFSEECSFPDPFERVVRTKPYPQLHTKAGREIARLFAFSCFLRRRCERFFSRQAETQVREIFWRPEGTLGFLSLT